MTHKYLWKLRGFVPEKPPWWEAWCAEAEGRLRRGENPFGITTTDGTSSAFALGGTGVTLHVESAKGFVTALACIQTDKPVAVEYAAEANCADLKSGQIFLDPNIITTCPFRPETSFTERLDILSGLSLHEASHLDFSSPDLCEKARERGNLFFSIFNILDDEFIEMKATTRSAGYSGYIQAARRYMFGDAHRHLVGKDQSLLNIFLFFVRYPQALSWAEAAPYLTELEKIWHILTPFPQTEEEVCRAAEEIYGILNQGKGPQPSKKLVAFLAKVADHHPPSDKQAVAEKLLTKLKPTGPVSGKLGTIFTLPPCLESKAEVSWNVKWESPEGDKTQYEKDRRTVLPHIMNLRWWLKQWEAQRERALKGQRSGALDRQKLYSLPLGSESVFQRREKDAKKDFTVVLLIDESASMSKDKISKARQVAVLFKEALLPVEDIELFIYGHTADIPTGTTTLFCYWTPRGKKKPYSLGAVQARSNNRDGVAIQAVAQEVKRLACNREILMLVISDGIPVANNYTGKAAIEHTRRVVRSLRSLRIIHIGIDPSLESRYMFDHHFCFTNLPDLLRQMSRLLQRTLSYL